MSKELKLFLVTTNEGTTVAVEGKEISYQDGVLYVIGAGDECLGMFPMGYWARVLLE